MDSLCASLYENRIIRTEAISHGRIYERKALLEFEKKEKRKVERCGLFVDPAYPYLGASPDGLTDNGKSLVEVKCPFSARDSMICPETVPYLCKENNKISLRKNHNYFFQVQGQLCLTRKEKCYFVVFTRKDLFIEEISQDPAFFQNEMLPGLKKFYEKYYRPYVASKL